MSGLYLSAITNDADIIDSRDVIGRIEYLSGYGEELDPEGREELESLTAFAEEMSDYLPDWTHGEALIRDSYFEDYARELADDIGAIDSDAGWPTSYIDWPRAADALKLDYSSGELDGVTYWGRS